MVESSFYLHKLTYMVRL